MILSNFIDRQGKTALMQYFVLIITIIIYSTA